MLINETSLASWQRTDYDVVTVLEQRMCVPVKGLKRLYASPTCSSRLASLCTLSSSSSSVSEEFSDGDDDSLSLLSELDGPCALSFFTLFWLEDGAEFLGSSGILEKRNSKTSWVKNILHLPIGKIRQTMDFERWSKHLKTHLKFSCHGHYLMAGWIVFVAVWEHDSHICSELQCIGVLTSFHLFLLEKNKPITYKTITVSKAYPVILTQPWYSLWWYSYP